MSLSNIGLPGLLVIFGIVILLFGSRKIPEIMEGVGKGIKKFKDTQSNVKSELRKLDDDKSEKSDKT